MGFRTINLLLVFASAVLFVFGAGQSGCQDQPIPCGALETVGKVTDTKATVQLTANESCTPNVTFQLFYDTEQREPGAYANQTEVLTGFVEHDPIVFNLTGLVPDTRYYYRVAYGLNGQWIFRPEYTFHTRRP